MIQKSKRRKYEPSSEPLHISAKELTDLSLTDPKLTGSKLTDPKLTDPDTEGSAQVAEI